MHVASAAAPGDLTVLADEEAAAFIRVFFERVADDLGQNFSRDLYCHASSSPS
jgi:hypothetical protein